MSEYKNQRNKRIARRYDDLAEEGKHGYYKILFKIIRKEIDVFARCLRDIYLNDKEYIELNNLGDPHHNQIMKDARNLLIESEYINDKVGEKRIFKDNEIYDFNRNEYSFCNFGENFSIDTYERLEWINNISDRFILPFKNIPLGTNVPIKPIEK